MFRDTLEACELEPALPRADDRTHAGHSPGPDAILGVVEFVELLSPCHRHRFGERAHAQLKSWKIVRKIRCCPRRATDLVKAILVLIQAG
jgi:hypothetical protein